MCRVLIYAGLLVSCLAIDFIAGETKLAFNFEEAKDASDEEVKEAITAVNEWADASIRSDDTTHQVKMMVYSTAKALVKLMRGYKQIPKSLTDMLARKRMIELSRTGSCKPDSTCGAVFDFSAITNYGCWCYFGGNAGKGFGIPRNPIDEICRDLQMCYRCAKIDSLLEPEICHPGKTSYRVEMNHEVLTGNILASCKATNQNDNCELHTCCCETDFITKLVKLLWDGYEFEPKYKHDIFEDFENQCFQGDGLHVIDCCGEYPERKPYFADGDMECCGGIHLFNTNKKVCCDDGTVGLDCYM